jgi:hypothetical protein
LGEENIPKALGQFQTCMDQTRLAVHHILSENHRDLLALKAELETKISNFK